MKKIILDEIIDSITSKSDSDFYGSDRECVKEIMMEFGKQLLNLAAQNGETKFVHQWSDTVEVDKFSIVRTINEVE